MRRRFMTSTGMDYSRIIRYTSSDGKMVKVNTSSIYTFGAAIKTHTYTDDGGLIEFDALPTQIPQEAFSGASNLKTIVLPDSIIRIGRYAFEFCTSLESIEFGIQGNEGIDINDYIFYGCTNLKKIIFHDPCEPSVSGHSMSDIGTMGISVYLPTESYDAYGMVYLPLLSPATADVNNFFPVTLVSGTTTEIGKELFTRCKELGTGFINLPGSVTIDGIITVQSAVVTGGDPGVVVLAQNYLLQQSGYIFFQEQN